MRLLYLMAAPAASAEVVAQADRAYVNGVLPIWPDW